MYIVNNASVCRRNTFLFNHCQAFTDMARRLLVWIFHLSILPLLVSAPEHCDHALSVVWHPSSVVNFSRFRLLLWNRETELNETWQKARSQRPLPSLCFWLIEKTIWPPWPLIGWGILDFSSETAERNSKKLNKKQDLNVLYQVFNYWADRQYKMVVLASDSLRYFRLVLWNCRTEFNWTWQEARSQCTVPSLYFLADRQFNIAALISD